MPEAPPIALHCEGLSKSFGAATAVDDASFHVTAGSILALLGPSGCGKTTTLRLIAGLDQPDAGTIVLGDSVVHGPDVSVPPERRRVGLVFQDYALFPHLDVRANVGFGLSRRNGRAARVAETLELVGLSALASRMPHELSGGQQQRVALGPRAGAQSRAWCCWTSRSRTSTRRCAKNCEPTCAASWAKPGQRPCWSPTIKRKR